MLFDRDFGNDAFFLVAPVQAACACWMLSVGWMWCGGQLWQWPRWDGGSGPAVPPCWSVQRAPFSARAVLGGHTQGRQWCSVALAHKTEQMAHPLAVAWGPGQPGSPTVAIWQCRLVTCTSLLSLPVAWFAQSLTFPWWLANDDCVPSGYFCATWVTLHWGASVWNKPVQQWLSFPSGVWNILLAYQQQCHLCPA